ncbi:alpha-L-rhamnosidase [Sphingomonas faeni]|uniref:alpha-L-rhamnosidase n=1 Tax=Sphingomonas faeni TaxID=185950 RepID=UPI00278B993C|nr:alpha-L-rhamnosidase [Sphingomonas faeni]MDQ0839925.1 alpha-L-rhamnosidase [Sphingomonas faeni]
MMDAVSDVRVVDLRAEHTTDLLGTDVRHPRLSWRIEARARGVVQHRYRIRSARAPGALAAGDLVWDSGDVASDTTFDIRYGGPPLVSMQRIWWSVEIVTAGGQRACSDPAWFEAGLLDAGDWQGDWLEAEDAFAAADRATGLAWIWSTTALDPRSHAFRLDFDIPADIVRSDILVSGKDHLRGVWIDGVATTLAGANGYDSPLPFWGSLSLVETTLRPGRATICVLVEADTEGFFPVDGGAFAALVRLYRANGSVERIVSGPRWHVLPDPPEDWQAPGFDARDWPSAEPSGANVHNDPRPPEPVMMLQTGFMARNEVASARLYATALGAYAATINGVAVSDAILSPEISVASDHVFYQTCDVTALIAPGDNVIGALVADGWYASPFGWRIERYGFGPAPRRFLAQLRIDYADGSHDWIVTGPEWRTAPSAILMSEIYDGETVDARRASPGWDRPGFDASAWTPARVGTPPDTRLIPLTSPPVRATGERRAITVTEPVPGRFVFDFGQNFSGWARITASGASGTTITARFAELLASDCTVDMANLRLARATDRFTLAGTGTPETLEPRFTYHGFRYIEVEGYPGIPTLDDVIGIVGHSDCRLTGDMTLPDAPLLQTIWRNALWSQRSNFFAVPTDCPQRDERMGWMGDIQVFLDAAAFNMEVDPFIRRFLVEARAAQRSDGGYPIVVPQPQSFPDVVTAGWSEAGIILSWQLWQRYGDTAVIDENWAAMEAWMAHIARTNPDHVWRNDRGLDLGDWLSVDAVKPDDETTPRGLCATAYWAWSAAMMADMAGATGRGLNAERYATLRRAIGQAFVSEYVAADGIVGNGSQTGQVLALHMGLVPTDLSAATARVLADDIRRRGMTLSTGFLGTPYILDVLADAGCMDVVTGLLLQTAYPSWGYMVAQGATSMWERWNGDIGDVAMNSYNHYAFGAVVGFFYRRLAGIASVAPGFRRIAVRPLWLPEIGRVAASYESCIGRIATATEGDATGLTQLSLTVPANAVADVQLPARAWTESGRMLADHPDIRAIDTQDSVLRFSVGSGEYRFALRD